MKPTVYPLWYNDPVWFDEKGFNTYQVFKNFKSIPPGSNSLVVFHGGADIDPIYYGEEPHPMTGNLDRGRDVWESEAFDHCIANKIPVFAICRGAQWACIKAGGKLIQHIEGHNGSNHTLFEYDPLFDSDKQLMNVNSVHHQAMNLDNTDGHLMAISADGIPEVVWFPKIKTVAVQFHPEWMPMNHEVNTTYIPKLLWEFLGIK